MKTRVLIKRYIIICVIIGSFSMSSIANAEVDACLGIWRGTMHRFGVPWATQVELIISNTTGEECGSFRYPNEKGGGILINCKEYPTYVEFTERYKYGGKMPAGLIQIKCGFKDKLFMRWIGPGLNRTFGPQLLTRAEEHYSPYYLVINRIIELKGQCIIGKTYLNHKYIGYSLELPWRFNQNRVSAIPVGKYTGIIRYDHKDKWRIQLENVKNRKHIQIHIGNYPSDILGCILVGKKWNGKTCAIQESASVYNELKRLFYGSKNPSYCPNKKIIVEIFINEDAICK